jgi:hypothetical protein
MHTDGFLSGADLAHWGKESTMRTRYLLIFAFVLSIVGTLANPGSAEVDLESIVGMWLFDGDVKDYSGNGNDGIPSNVEWTDGVFGKALDLGSDWDSYVEITMSPSLDVVGKSDFTLTFWLNPDVIGPVQMVFQQRDNGGMGRTIIDLNDARMSSYLGGADSFVNNTPLEAGEWYHIALSVTKSGTLQWYIDGEPQESYEKGLEEAGGNYLIGIHKAQANVPYDGQIDDFGFFNVVLTQDEINQVMTAGLQLLAAVEPSDKLTTTWASVKNQ